MGFLGKRRAMSMLPPGWPAIAQSGQILIGPSTKDRLGEHYVIESAGPRKLKNIEEEIEAFRVVGKAY